MTPKTIGIVAPINQTGVGIHAQSLLAELIKKSVELEAMGVRLYIYPSTIVSHTLGFETGIANHLMNQVQPKKVDLLIVLDLIDRFISGRLAQVCPQADKTVLYTVYEVQPKGIDRVKADWIWVPSLFQAEQLKSLGFINVKVVPEGTFRPFVLQERPDPSRVMYTIGSIGKCEKRKGQDVLLPAVQEASGRLGKHVQIYARWSNPWVKEAEHNLLMSHGFRSEYNEAYKPVHDYYAGGGGHGELFSDNQYSIRTSLFPRSDSMLAVYSPFAHVDLMVFPHRAEGWGLSVLDSMASGVPTMFSYHTGSGIGSYADDYLSLAPDNLAIRAFQAEPAIDNVFFPASKDPGEWYPPIHSDLVDQLVEVLSIVTHPTGRYDYIARCKEAADRVAERYSWANSASIFLEEACKIL